MERKESDALCRELAGLCSYNLQAMFDRLWRAIQSLQAVSDNRIVELESRLRTIEEPGKLGARYKALEEMARPAGYTGFEAEPVETFVWRRIKALEGEKQRMLAVACGCDEYGGGYSGQQARVYHHGIQTVINALDHAVREPDDSQVMVLERIGRATLGQTEKEARNFLDRQANEDCAELRPVAEKEAQCKSSE